MFPTTLPTKSPTNIIDNIPDLKFYLKVDDYTSGNAWIDRVSNIEVNVPGSASFHEGYVQLSGTAITAPLQTNPNVMQSATYVIRLRVPTIPSNLGWVMSQFPDYGWSRALTISDYRLGHVGQTPGHFQSGLGSFPTDSWQVLVGTWTQGGACQTFLQGTSGNSRSCSNERGTDSSEKLIIGGRGETDGNHNPQSIDISDVLVFNRVLNTDEINFITSTLSEPKRCPAETFCDADGFQLAMQFSSNSIFNFDSNYWTDETLLGTSGEGISNKDGKYKAFNELRATEIKICAVSCVTLTIPDSHSGQTLKEIFSSVTSGPTGLEFDSSKIEEFRAAFGAPASTYPYQKLKLNFDDTDSGYQCKGRLALIQNNEANHVTANDAIGLGAQEAGGNGAGATIAIWPHHSTSLQAQLYVKGVVDSPACQDLEGIIAVGGEGDLTCDMVNIPDHYCDNPLFEYGSTAPPGAWYDDSATLAQLCPVTLKGICNTCASKARRNLGVGRLLALEDALFHGDEQEFA